MCVITFVVLQVCPRKALVMLRPVVGMTLDSESPGGYSNYPWYALRQNYCQAIADAGGLPLALPHHEDLAENYLDCIDALVVTGGGFDVDPKLYNAKEVHEKVKMRLKPDRTAFEMAMLKGALERDMPILGICGGQQLLNVVLGGTLIQYIPDAISNHLLHLDPGCKTKPAHSVSIVEDSNLFKILNCHDIDVNSSHQQAVATVGPDVVINAKSSDGVIEGIEYPLKKFCLGLQWHPEFVVTKCDEKVLKAFIRAAC